MSFTYEFSFLTATCIKLCKSIKEAVRVAGRREKVECRLNRIPLTLSDHDDRLPSGSGDDSLFPVLDNFIHCPSKPVSGVCIGQNVHKFAFSSIRGITAGVAFFRFVRVFRCGTT